MAEPSVAGRSDDSDPVAVFRVWLQKFRTECGNPSIRDLERLSVRNGRPQSRSVIQAKLTGRTTPDWAFVETFVEACVRHAGTGVDPGLQEWRDRHTRMLAALAEQRRPVPSVGPVCPYRGLEAFTAQEAVWFHGRGATVDEVLAALDRHRSAVMLLGPSGAGKSSLVQAGVLPALAAGRLPGSDRWLQVCARPGQDLPAELDRAGLSGAGASLSQAVRDRLADQPVGARLLLVIDQFEELLTPLPGAELERVRREMLGHLTRLIGTAGVTLVLVMRNDFYSQLADQAHDLLAAVTTVDLPASLSIEQLRDIVTKPATTAGLSWDTGLPEQIVTDVLADYDIAAARCVPITVLPLVELTLYQLWQRRACSRLTHDAYRQVGGVRGAITSWCTAAIDQFSPAEQRCAERVLTALVRPADTERNVPAVRQQVPVDVLRELAGPTDSTGPGGTDPAAVSLVDGVLAALTGHRIVTCRTPPVAPEGQAEVADWVPVAELVHDAVIRDWAVLRDWVDRDHRFQDWLHRTGERHRQWTRQRTADDLLHGSDLAEGISWSRHRPLPRDITAFLQASRQNHQARARRARRVNTALASLLAVVLVVASVAVWQWRTAVTAQQVALSRQVATQAQTLVDSRPDTAMLLGVQAYRTAPTMEARSALIGMSTHGAYQAEFTAHSGPVSDLAFTPGGRTLVTVSRDHSVAVWDTHDHHRIASLTEHDTWLRAVAITADGSTMASSGDDHGIIVWDSAGHVRIATLAGHIGAVKDVAFSPDGRLLASGGTDDTVIIWNLAQHTAIARLTGHGGTVNSVEFSPDGRLLAAAGTGRTIVVWDVATHTRVKTLVGHTDAVREVAFDPRGRYLASAGDTTVRLWNIVDGSPRKVLTGHTQGVIALAVSPDGSTVASAGYDTTVLLWDVAHGVLRARLAGHTTSVYTLAFGTDSTLASAGERGSVILWNTQRASLTEPDKNGVNDLAFAPDGLTLAAPASNRTTLWDARIRTRRDILTGGSTVNAVAFSPDGKLLATADEGNTVTLWALKNNTQVARLTGHKAAVLDVAFSPDGRALVSGGVDHTAIVWDVATRTARTTLTGHDEPINGVAFSPDGHTLATGSHDFTVVLWDTTTWLPRTRLTGHTGWVRSVAFSPDGHTIATASSDSTVRLWDAATSAARATLTGHLDAEYNGVAFSPDGTALAFTGGAYTISLWKLKTRENWARLAGHTKPIRAQAFSPDGRTLVTAGGDGDHAVLFWNTDPAQTAQEICDTVGRELTDDEWNQFVPDLPHHNTC